MIIFKETEKFILKDVNVCIPKGTVVGIIGTSGAGKTTFLKLLCGLLKPEKGEVYTFHKEPVKNRKRNGNRLSFLFTDFPLMKSELSLEQNFLEQKLIYGMKENDFRQRYERLGRILGFEEYLESSPRVLSLGQRRRAELGLVFLRETELCVMDEPGIGLDLNAKECLKQLILEKKEKGATVLISSHDMSEIAETCDRILLLDRGRVVYYGDKNMLLQRYAPIKKCELSFEGEIPSFEDMPILHYELDNNHLTITFHSHHISAAEILSHITSQTTILTVKMTDGNLVDTIKAMVGGER